MTKEQAEVVAAKLEAFCKSHGLWYSVTKENKPNLSMIKFNEISIKVTKK